MPINTTNIRCPTHSPWAPLETMKYPLYSGMGGYLDADQLGQSNLAALLSCAPCTTITSARWQMLSAFMFFECLCPALCRTFMTAAQSPNHFDVLDFRVLMQLCTAYTLYNKIHSLFAYFPCMFSQSRTLTILLVPVNIMAPSTRRTKRASSSSDDPDLAGPQQKKLKFRRSKGGATPSLIAMFPCSAKEHPTTSHSTESPPAKAPRGRPPRYKKNPTEPEASAFPSFIVTFPFSAKEHPTRSVSTEGPPTKAPRSRPRRNKQKADQRNNSFSVDKRPKSWGMPEVWAEVFH